MTQAADQVAAWLDGMTAEARDDLARRYAAATRAGGAVVRKPDGHVVPIPPLLTPEGMTAVRLAEMGADSHALLVSLGHLTAWLLSDDPEAQAEQARLFRAFSPVESEGLHATWRQAERLATARVDFFLDEDEQPRALEVNATIPAMQGYSDVIAEEFLRHAGAARGLDDAAIAALIDANGRNSDDLLAALIEHHRRLVPSPPERLAIAIVARGGDAQLGELEHYAARWTALGHCPRICTPEDVRIDGVELRVGEMVPDLVYRHIFARRLDIKSDFARACLRPDVFRIFNPIASHLEVKGMLGYLSAAAAPDGGAFGARLGLDDDARGAIARSLPWTRVLGRGPTRGPEGESITDLAAAVAAEGKHFVLKRSWDYGGKSVFLGAHHDDAAAVRAAEALGRDDGHEHPVSWRELVEAATTDERDAWVVQGFVRTRPRRHLVASDAGAEWKQLYVDLSIYSNLGVAAIPRGGASRAAPGRIVNILGGGGLAPLIRDEVLLRLLG